MLKIKKVTFVFFINNFEYGGINSAKYGLFFGHVDTERLKQICGEIKYNTQYYSSQNKRAIHGINKDDSPLSFELEIISAEPISYRTAGEIKHWLFNSPTYKKLYSSRIKDKTIEKINGEEKRIFVECIFSNPEAMFYADGLHGWKCMCNLSSAFAFQDEIELTFTDFTNNIVIPVDSDNNDYLYPSFIITAVSTSQQVDISLINQSDNNRTMKLIGIPASTIISVDTAIGMIEDNTSQSLYTSLQNQKFLRLVNGNNNILVSGATSLTMRYQNVRYLL